MEVFGSVTIDFEFLTLTIPIHSSSTPSSVPQQQRKVIITINHQSVRRPTINQSIAGVVIMPLFPLLLLHLALSPSSYHPKSLS